MEGLLQVVAGLRCCFKFYEMRFGIYLSFLN